jgi:perosamine synthetase
MMNSPIRTKPFAPSAYTSGNEKELLLDCLESNNWSSFKGSTEGWDIKEVGVMPSVKAAECGPLENRFLGGKYVRELESIFAGDMGVGYCVSSNSATSCLVMAIGALNLGPGDEVIVPCMSFNATATAILAYNAIPVFCEVKKDTFCLDPNDVVDKISNMTKSIMVVHLGENGADMDRILEIAKKNKLSVIEDCAQAPGVTYKGKPLGTFGDVGVFSLTETKNITCGEGGLLITNREDIAIKSRLIRNHGEGVVEEDWSDDELVNVIGMNYRLTEFQAAVAIPQVKSLKERNQKRRELTNYLLEGLAEFNSILIPPVVEDGVEYCCFMLKWKWQPQTGMPSRDELVLALQEQGIPVGKGYGRMMHENPIFTRKLAYTKGCPFDCHHAESSKAKYGMGTLPSSEAVNRQFLWFKFINPPNTKADMDDVIHAFKKVLDK